MSKKVKIALVGDVKVGKSAFIQRFRKEQYSNGQKKKPKDITETPASFRNNSTNLDKNNSPPVLNAKFLANYYEKSFPDAEFSKNLHLVKVRRRCPCHNCTVIFSVSAEDKKAKEQIVDITFFDVPRLENFPSNSLEEWELDGAIGMRSADAFILLYDVTNDESFEYVKRIGNDILEVTNVQNYRCCITYIRFTVRCSLVEFFCSVRNYQ